MTSSKKNRGGVFAELEIIRPKSDGSIDLKFGGDLAKEFRKYTAAGYVGAFSNSHGPLLQTSHFQAEFAKEGHATIKYDLIFVRHHSGSFIRLNSMSEAKSCLPYIPEWVASVH